MDFLTKHQLLSKLLAAAVLDLAPKAQLVDARGTRWGFTADFAFKDPLAKEQLPFVKKRMETLLEEETIEQVEMLSDNLALYFKDQRQVIRAAKAKALDGEVVNVIKVGPFLDYSETLFDLELSDPFSLIDIIECEPMPFRGHLEHVVRITGRLGSGPIAPDHIELGQAQKLFSRFPKKPQAEGEPVTIFWHPKGTKLKRDLKQFWEEHIQEGGFSLVESPTTLRDYQAHFKGGPWAQLQKTYNENFSQDLIDLEEATVDRLIATDKTSSAHFLLQFIVKTFNILDLKWAPVLVRPLRRKSPKISGECESILREACDELSLECEIEFSQQTFEGARLEFMVCDAYGVSWSGPYLHVFPTEDGLEFELSLFNSFERMIALMLENQERGKEIDYTWK